MTALLQSLRLPPKSASPTPVNIAALNDGLTSVMPFHPRSTVPWDFYDVVDEYLGPWGMSGYPLAYGRFYCMRFTQMGREYNDNVLSQWVDNTCILLQHYVRDFILARFRSHTLASLTEAELREAAFASHPEAYDRGGLSMLMNWSLKDVFWVATIPAAEFLPFHLDTRFIPYLPATPLIAIVLGLRWNDTFFPTWVQVFKTGMRLLYFDLGPAGLATLSPAFTRMTSGMASTLLQGASQDLDRLSQFAMLNRGFSQLLRDIRAGHMDNIALLNTLTYGLASAEFTDTGAALQDVVRTIIASANHRKWEIATRVNGIVAQRPDLRSAADTHQPGWADWLTYDGE